MNKQVSNVLGKGIFIGKSFSTKKIELEEYKEADSNRLNKKIALMKNIM